MLIKRKGQSTLEYAMIIMVIAAGIIAMQVYMKRSVQGKLRESTDSIGKQYSAGKTASLVTTEKKETSKTKEAFGVSGRGISRYEILEVSDIEQTATGDDAEKIDTKLEDESLF